MRQSTVRSPNITRDFGGQSVTCIANRLDIQVDPIRGIRLWVNCRFMQFFSLFFLVPFSLGLFPLIWWYFPPYGALESVLFKPMLSVARGISLFHEYIFKATLGYPAVGRN